MHHTCIFFYTQVVKIAGHEVRALRLSFVGELGWELHIPNESAVPVYEAVMQAGQQHGIVNAGYRAIESLSLEKGVFCMIHSPFGKWEDINFFFM